MKSLFQYITFFLIVLFSHNLAIAQMSEIELTETEAAFVKAQPVIKVANEMDWPPFDYTELGRPRGYSIDYIQLLAKKAGLKIKFINGYTWDELLEQFKSGNIDVIPALYHNKEREGFTLFTEPYYELKMGFLTRDKESELKKLSNLDGKRVGIQESDGLIPAIKAKVPGVTLIENAENETLIDLLVTRKLDAVFGNTLLLAYLARRNQAAPLHLATFMEIDFAEHQKASLHVGVGRKSPLLHQILMKAQESVTNAEMTEIEQKWLSSQNPVRPASPVVELTSKEEKFIKEHPEVSLAGGVSFAPFLMQNKSGKVIGYDAEIVALVAQRTGLKLRIELGVWQEIQERAKDRELDGLLTASPTKERELYYNKSEPYIHLTPLVIVKRGNPIGIYSLEDISGKRVALQRGNAFKEILEKDVKDFEAIYFDSIQEVVKAVVSGKVDCTLFEESAFYVARQLGLESMIEGAFATAGATGLHFQLRNDWPELVTIVNKGLESITRREMLEIRNRWLAVKMGNAGSSGKIQLTSDERIYLAQKGTIKVCVDPTWMPYERINEEGVYEGMSADYLELFSDRLGVPVEILPTSNWRETLDAVKNGQCDIIPLAKASEERRSYLNFTTPYLSFPYVIATKTGEFFIEDIGQALDKTFAVTRGYLVTNELRQKYPEIKILEVNNNIEGVQKVVSGEAYGYIDATAALSYVLYQENITAIKIAGKLPMGFELGVASRKDEPLLHDLFQKAVATLTETEKRRIHDKWIAVNVHKIVDYALLWKILGLIAIIIAILAESRRRVAKANQKLSTLNFELVTALDEIRTLKGIIPICMHCKEIRDDKGSWNQLEKYITEHSEAQFSHGLCDKCAERYYSDELN